MVTITEEIKREIGQHFVLGFHGYEASENIEVLIRQYYLGNVILMKRNVRSAQQVHSVVQRLQQIARDAGHEMPLMIGTDQENGLVSAFSLEATDEAGTQFPGAMALAATGSPDLAERVSAASARELKFAGINWTYSPVADVNSDSRNPVIGIRSFGDDAHEVSIYAAAVSRGLTSSGVAPCPKHFPGHGDTHVDSHLALPVIPKTLVQLSQIELVPFQALANEAATIMTGHMALPRITGDDTPASLARAATHGLLRESLHYDGVIVTDCLEMEAVAARPGGVSAAAVDALRAGADIVMVCHRFARHVASFEAVYEAVASGTLDVTELRASGQRIAKLKAAFAGTWTQAANAPFVSANWRALKAQNKLLSHEAYAASIAVVQDPQSTLPLPKAGPVVVFTPRMESLNLAVDDADGILRTADGQLRNTAGPSYVEFARNVRDRIGTGAVHAVYVPMDGLSAEHEEQLRSASAIVFATRNADRSSWQLDYLRKVLRVRKDNVVVLGSCAPYDLLALGKDDELRSVTYVVSFEFTATALTAAAAVIFGDAQAAGRVPVCGGKVVG